MMKKEKRLRRAVKTRAHIRTRGTRAAHRTPHAAGTSMRS